MKSAIILIMTFLLCAVVFSGSCTGTNLVDTGNTTPDVPATIPFPEDTPREELVAFVEDAVAYAEENGKEKALQEFDDRDGEFVRGDLYIFALDFKCISLAHLTQPDVIGTNRTDLQDINGVTYVQNVAHLAKSGGAFTYYFYPNPEKNMTEELKLSYVVKVDDTWWLGSGIYLADVPSYFSPDSREEQVTFVEGALTYARDNGKNKALQEFNDREGDFVDGDRYIFAYDFQGITLALPHQPDLLGINRADYQDINGVTLVQNMADLAKSGGGFAYYIYPNPGKNMTEELKLSYVVKVDDTWYLGSGIYGTELNETAENASLQQPSTKEELVAFVESAVAFARENGREKAIEEFMDTTGPFVNGESYIFVHDFNGTALALPYLPSEVGTNRLDYQDAGGVYIGRKMRSIALNGSGFFQYVYPNPVTNTTEPKLSYVMKVDDTWWLGSGIYLQDADEMDTST